MWYVGRALENEAWTLAREVARRTGDASELAYTWVDPRAAAREKLGAAGQDKTLARAASIFCHEKGLSWRSDWHATDMWAISGDWAWFFPWAWC